MAIKVVVSYSTEDLPVEPQVQRGRGLVEDGASGRVDVVTTRRALVGRTRSRPVERPLSLALRALSVPTIRRKPRSGSER